MGLGFRVQGFGLRVLGFSRVFGCSRSGGFRGTFCGDEVLGFRVSRFRFASPKGPKYCYGAYFPKSQ